jgi:hypothetical protein
MWAPRRTQPAWSPRYSLGKDPTENHLPQFFSCCYGRLPSDSSDIVDVFTSRYQATYIPSRNLCIVTVLHATVLSSHLHLRRPSDLFPSDFPTKKSYMLSSFPPSSLHIYRWENSFEPTLKRKTEHVFFSPKSCCLQSTQKGRSFARIVNAVHTFLTSWL